MNHKEQNKEYIIITIARCDFPLTGIAAQLLSSLSETEMQTIAQRMAQRSLTQNFWEDFALIVSMALLERKTR